MPFFSRRIATHPTAQSLLLYVSSRHVAPADALGSGWPLGPTAPNVQIPFVLLICHCRERMADTTDGNEPSVPWRTLGFAVGSIGTIMLVFGLALFGARDERTRAVDAYNARAASWASSGEATSVAQWSVVINGVAALRSTTIVAPAGGASAAASHGHSATVPAGAISGTVIVSATAAATTSDVPPGFSAIAPVASAAFLDIACNATSCSSNCGVGAATPARRCSAATLQGTCAARVPGATYVGPAECIESGPCGRCAFTAYATELCVLVERRLTAGVAQWLPARVVPSCRYPFSNASTQTTVPPTTVAVTVHALNDPVVMSSNATLGSMSFERFAARSVAAPVALVCCGVVCVGSSIAVLVVSVRRALNKPHTFVPWVPGGVSALAARIALFGILTLTIAYLVGAVLLDGVAGTVNYSEFEWSLTALRMREVIDSWDAAARSAIAVNSGAHMLAAVLYPLLLSVWHLRLATAAADAHRIVLAVVANTFSTVVPVVGVAYVCSHSCLVSVLVSRDAVAEETVLAAALFLILFFAVLVPAIVVAAVTSLVLVCAPKTTAAEPTEA